MENTDKANYVFTIKEYDKGISWIALEPTGEQPEALKNVLLGFDLPEGTTLAQAEAIASYLNNSLCALNYTKLES